MKLVSETKKKAAEREIKNHLDNPVEARRLAMESIADEEDKPTRTRYIVNDATVEKLGEILNENPSGVLVYRDELIGLLKNLEKEGQEGARAFYLEAWNGTGRFTFDRIGRGTVDIEAATVSIVGGIQPGPLAQYLHAAAREGKGDDGLIQRFQLLVMPDICKEWVNVDRAPDKSARESAYAVFDGLAGFEPVLIGAEDDATEKSGIPFLRFDQTAQEQFNAWREALEKRLRSGELHPALESHLAKYRSLIPSLALLIHLAEGGDGAVSASALDRGIRWGEYLESHARRIYSQAIDPAMTAARALATRVLKGELGREFGGRDLYRKGWTGLSTPEDAKRAVEVLVEFEWLAEQYRNTEGRTATVYVVSPKLAGSEAAKSLSAALKGTDRTARRADEGASGGSVSDGSGEPPDFRSGEQSGGAA